MPSPQPQEGRLRIVHIGISTQLDPIRAERVAGGHQLCPQPCRADRVPVTQPRQGLRAQLVDSGHQGEIVRGPDKGRSVGQRGRILGAATQVGNAGHALPCVAERTFVILPSSLLQQLESGRRIRSRQFPHDRQLRVGLAVRTGLLSGQMSGSTGVPDTFSFYGRLMSIRVSTPVRRSAGESRSSGRIRTVGLICAFGGLLGAALRRANAGRAANGRAGPF